MKLEYSEIRQRLEAAKADALRVYNIDKAAFDSGRYDGLKQAIQILDSLYDEQ